MKLIDYSKATTDEFIAIGKIARRYCEMTNAPFIDTEMDITAVHCNCMKLDLDRLVKADDFNLAHDVGGIATHLDRENIKLINCFVPRFALK